MTIKAPQVHAMARELSRSAAVLPGQEELDRLLATAAINPVPLEQSQVHWALEGWRRPTAATQSAQRNYSEVMIRSFRCADTETPVKDWDVSRIKAFERVARRKLRQLELAKRLDYH